MPSTSPPYVPPAKPGMHPRNRHRDGYDFARLIAAYPGLQRFIIKTPAGTDSIDFAHPQAVKALNRALLMADYGVQEWDIPGQYLVPPIPGRMDHLHYLADLLAEDFRGVIPQGNQIRVLDIGVGANLIYPLVGRHEYGWRFLGMDIDPLALANARKLITANQGAGVIEVRHQPNPEHIFRGCLRSGEKYDLSLCNPPFHGSPAEVLEAAQSKWKKLGKAGPGQTPPRLNFGGKSTELWCPGGERGFIEAMLKQSAEIPKRCLWFSTLISRQENLPPLLAILDKLRPRDKRVIEVRQGQKQSRILAWTFMPATDRYRWIKTRWSTPEAVPLPEPAVIPSTPDSLPETP